MNADKRPDITKQVQEHMEQSNQMFQDGLQKLITKIIMKDKSIQRGEGPTRKSIEDISDLIIKYVVDTLLVTMDTNKDTVFLIRRFCGDWAPIYLKDKIAEYQVMYNLQTREEVVNYVNGLFIALRDDLRKQADSIDNMLNNKGVTH